MCSDEFSLKLALPTISPSFRWIPTQVSGPQKDLEQNLTDSSIEYKDGVLKMNFTRPRHLTDLRDLSFTDDDCHYFVYPIGGGDVSDDGTLKTHHVMPIVSKRKICVRDRGTVYSLSVCC